MASSLVRSSGMAKVSTRGVMQSLHRLVAELDDFLDHFALGGLERAFLGADLDERLEFLFAEHAVGLEAARRELFGDPSERLCRRRLTGSSSGMASCSARTPSFAKLYRAAQGDDFRAEIAHAAMSVNGDALSAKGMPGASCRSR